MDLFDEGEGGLVGIEFLGVVEGVEFILVEVDEGKVEEVFFVGVFRNGEG